MEGKKKDLFYCYKEAVATFLMRRGIAPSYSGVNKNTGSSYWAFERGPVLDAGLDAWQKEKWLMKPKQMEEAKHDGNKAQ